MSIKTKFIEVVKEDDKDGEERQRLLQEIRGDLSRSGERVIFLKPEEGYSLFNHVVAVYNRYGEQIGCLNNDAAGKMLESVRDVGLAYAEVLDITITGSKKNKICKCNIEIPSDGEKLTHRINVSERYWDAVEVSIKKQTKWKRPHTHMLLQDADFLLRVTRYDYDIEAPDFKEYAKRRGSLEGAGYEGSDRWKIVMEHSWTLDKFLDSGLLSDNSKNPQATKYLKFDEEHMRSTWKSILIAKARLQDTWEIWRNDLEISVVAV